MAETPTERQYLKVQRRKLERDHEQRLDELHYDKKGKAAEETRYALVLDDLIRQEAAAYSVEEWLLRIGLAIAKLTDQVQTIRSWITFGGIALIILLVIAACNLRIF